MYINSFSLEFCLILFEMFEYKKEEKEVNEDSEWISDKNIVEKDGFWTC